MFTILKKYDEIFFLLRAALKNFERCVKPGGLLLIDHRNYDYIVSTGQTPAKCIYYNVSAYATQITALSKRLHALNKYYFYFRATTPLILKPQFFLCLDNQQW